MTATLSTHFTTYLQAETLRCIEEAAGTPERDAAIEAAAMSATPDFAGRILERARRFDTRFGIDRALRRTGGHLRLAILLLSGLGFTVGIGTAQILPAGFPARANVVTVLLALLLPHTIALALWGFVGISGVVGASPRAAAAWLGRRAVDLQRTLAQRDRGDTVTRAAIQAWGTLLTETKAGRHHLACVSHRFWLAHLTGSLLGCWWLLTVRQVEFSWGSTLLGPDDMQSILGTLTHAVAAFGLPAPTEGDIAASAVGESSLDPELRRRWGLFLLAVIATLGVLPRLAALSYDLALGSWRSRRLPLNLQRPGFARLRPILLPVPTQREVLDPNTGPNERLEPAIHDGTISKPPGGSAWIGLDRFPEPLPFITDDTTLLGTIVTRADRERIHDLIATDSWPAICVAVDLATTPDRGVARLIEELRQRARRPLHLVVIATPRAALLSGADRRIRRDDWLVLGARAGLPPDRVHVPDDGNGEVMR
ncbi:MAG: DUF2868 domain-containing protein [Gammaproteobacteria bacterium]|nr:DUF2868 domain-containing protein [Gammaproteobacteria bacterium]